VALAVVFLVFFSRGISSAMTCTTDVPSQSDGSGTTPTFSVATWNIRNGRNGGIESACRALGSLNVDIAVLQETKLTNGIYTRNSSGYSIVASDAPSKQKGGIALCWRESRLYELEEARFLSPHVLTFRLITGGLRYYVVGCYIPPKSVAELTHIRQAYAACPNGFQPILIGDLNIDLESPRDERDEEIAEQVDWMDLGCMSRSFTQRRRRRTRGRWTWRQSRLGRWISSTPDYFLTRRGVRKRFKKVVIRRPRHHDSDHRAIVAHFFAGHKRKMISYRKRHCTFPLRLGTGPHQELETIFEELKASAVPIAARERPQNAWISDTTWAIIDHKAMLRRGGRLPKASEHSLGRKINQSLKKDRETRAANHADSMESHLNNGDLKEAWRVVQRYTRVAEERGPTPCFDSMVKQTQERKELYAKVPPPGDPIPINVEPSPVRDEVPEEPEIREKVINLRNGRSGGAAKIRAEDIKQWLRGMIEEEEKGTEGAGDKWRLFVKLIQTIWRTGVLPQQMYWVIIVLIPKGGGDYRGIGLIEPFWKVIECIMDDRLNIIEFHDCLHGFLAGKGTGTATIEAKLSQQLAYIEQQPLYGVYIDLRKAYDAMDRDRCVLIMKAYGVGPNMLHLIENFWENAELVCRANGRFGTPFKAHRGVTQGGPVSPKIFNIMVDAMVREWIRQLVGDEAASTGLKDAIKLLLAIFYADDGYIASRSKEQLQEAIDLLADLFDRVGLCTNTSKTKGMTCVSGKIRTRLPEEVYTNSRVGFHTQRDWNNRLVECDICEEGMQANSLDNHLEKLHDVFRSKVLNRDLVEDRPPQRYRAQPCTATGQYICPVPSCVGTTTTPWNLRKHFIDRHPVDTVWIPGEGDYPQCHRCGMQTNPTAFCSTHYSSNLCVGGTVRKKQREAAAESVRALDVTFTAYGDELERVEVFKYLGRLMSMDDNDIQAVRSNMRKARKVWGRLSRLLRMDNASPRVCGMFYKATIQAVLLFGSETWNLTPSAMKQLEGFHKKAAWRMAKINTVRLDPETQTWQYPSTEDVFEEVGLFSIEHYINVRRQTIANYIVHRPIFPMCTGAGRRRGSSPRQFWWDQPMDLELARASASEDAGVVDIDE